VKNRVQLPPDFYRDLLLLQQRMPRFFDHVQALVHFLLKQDSPPEDPVTLEQSTRVFAIRIVEPEPLDPRNSVVYRVRLWADGNGILKIPGKNGGS
jgi:hypothetical protein